MKINGISNASFGRWDASTYYRIESQIKNACMSNNISDYKKTKLYKNFQYLNDHTSGSLLTVDTYNKIQDKNHIIHYFPSTKIASNALFRNINEAAEYGREKGFKSENDDLGIILEENKSSFDNSMLDEE